VGTLVQVGLGKFQPEEMVGMIESKDRRVAGMSAPAHGLVLWKVFYNAARNVKSETLDRKGPHSGIG
jgi:tRNA U38,U39,U40 pseudouridine synthase TruA